MPVGNGRTAGRNPAPLAPLPAQFCRQQRMTIPCSLTSRLKRRSVQITGHTYFDKVCHRIRRRIIRHHKLLECRQRKWEQRAGFGQCIVHESLPSSDSSDGVASTVTGGCRWGRFPDSIHSVSL